MSNTQKIEVSKSFGAYNTRRYSKPWGAVITLTDDGWHYDFAGVWLGDDDEGGDVVIKHVQPGQIVAFGQKDTRNPRHTENDWYAVQEDGSLLPVGKREARKIIATRENAE